MSLTYETRRYWYMNVHTKHGVPISDRWIHSAHNMPGLLEYMNEDYNRKIAWFHRLARIEKSKKNLNTLK